MKCKIYLLLIVCSCTVGSNYSKENFFNDEEIQKSIKLNKIENNDQRYEFSLYDFNDISLNKFMDDVQENSSTIKIAILKLKQARESLRIALN